MRLQGKTAIVTGGAKGLGEAMAKLFAKEGARVIIPDMVDPKNTYENVEPYKLNVTDSEACKKFAEYAIGTYKKIDILVNNAGILRDAMTRKMTDEQWDAVIGVNLKGAFNLTRYIGPHMEDTGGGSIINISSIVGEFGNIGQVNYAATKAAVVAMAKTWAREFARKGVPVRCNAIAPGYVLTEIYDAVPEEFLKGFAAKTTLGRLGKPEEVAYAALFLASDESSYITGHTLFVSGGARV
jgi:3-oxoacyl-[acyl-carrier protein] reductase